MKRYLLFAGDNYYPIGGWGDFINDFDSIDEAIKYQDLHPQEWAEICDSITKRIIKSFGTYCTPRNGTYKYWLDIDSET